MDPDKLPPGKQVLIVGAGPTGLVLALWLAHLGVKVRIIDKTAGPGTTSRALGVQARTLEFYRQLGFSQEVVDSGIKIAGVNLWLNGKRAVRVPLLQMGQGLTPFPYILMYPQDEHEKLLIRKLSDIGVSVERCTELLRFEEKSAGVVSVLKRRDGSEESFESSYLAGCDGASSTVRRTLTTEFPGGTYSHLFYVADVEASGPPTDKEVHIDLEDADFLAVFPLTRDGHVRVIGAVKDEVSGDRKNLTFADVRSRPMNNLKLDVKGENWFSTYRVHHRVAAKFRNGRVFILGDAAHLHSPVGAQGMNTGIGDAINLSWKLSMVLKGSAPESILDTFELERIAFARRLVATTDRVFTLATNRGIVSRCVRRGLLPFVMPRIISFNAARRALFRTVSQIAIRYRKSPLSSGSAGEIHGGDRVPWMELAGGGDTHASVTGLIWRAQVYGAPFPGMAEACRELGIPLEVYSWRPEMQRSGLLSGGFYLVRPDGYVALAERNCTAESLRGYFSQRGFSTPFQPQITECEAS